MATTTTPSTPEVKKAPITLTANAIAPALIATDMVTSNPNASPDRLPVGFFGSPDEIGRAVTDLIARGDLPKKKC